MTVVSLVPDWLLPGSALDLQIAYFGSSIL